MTAAIVDGPDLPVRPHLDSDGTCPECQSHHEQFCPNAVYTYNSPDEHTGKVTYGGHSDSVVVASCVTHTYYSRSGALVC